MIERNRFAFWTCGLWEDQKNTPLPQNYRELSAKLLKISLPSTPSTFLILRRHKLMSAWVIVGASSSPTLFCEKIL